MINVKRLTEFFTIFEGHKKNSGNKIKADLSVDITNIIIVGLDNLNFQVRYSPLLISSLILKRSNLQLINTMVFFVNVKFQAQYHFRFVCLTMC